MEEVMQMIDFVAPIEDKMQGIIKVVGVGGGGCNAVRNMYLDKVGGVTYAVMNTDSQSLSRSPVPYKIQLGAERWHEDGVRDSRHGWWHWYWCCSAGGRHRQGDGSADSGRGDDTVLL